MIIFTPFYVRKSSIVGFLDRKTVILSSHYSILSRLLSLLETGSISMSYKRVVSLLTPIIVDLCPLAYRSLSST